MKRLNLRIANKQSSNLKLISSAIKSISEKGINETTMSDVSQGAGSVSYTHLTLPTTPYV